MERSGRQVTCLDWKMTVELIDFSIEDALENRTMKVSFFYKKERMDSIKISAVGQPLILHNVKVSGSDSLAELVF